jgi:hypothetical protein
VGTREENRLFLPSLIPVTLIIQHANANVKVWGKKSRLYINVVGKHEKEQKMPNLADENNRHFLPLLLDKILCL